MRVESQAPHFQLDPGLDRSLIRSVFLRTARVHVPGVFSADTARLLHSTLVNDTPWQISTNSGDKHIDLDSEQLKLVPDAQQVLLSDAVTEGARRGFQYIFNNFPMYDLYSSGQRTEHLLIRFCAWLNSSAFLNFAREITGLNDIAMADAQATLYRPGHFLTVHDDNVAGKHRLAAYVLNFTPNWRADWGGILQFIDQDGHVAEGYVPTFNALNIFRVPQKHCVSYVTPAGAGRYSVTGWLRGK